MLRIVPESFAEKVFDFLEKMKTIQKETEKNFAQELNKIQFISMIKARIFR